MPPTFQPSKHSPGSHLSLVHSQPRARRNAVLTDTFADVDGVHYTITADGTITLNDNAYAAHGLPAGTKFARTDRRWEGMIKNLALVPGNKERLEALLSAPTVAAAVKAASTTLPVPVAAPSAATGAAPTTGKVPLTKQPWFWPAVIGGSALVIGGGVYYFYGDALSKYFDQQYRGAM